MIFSPQALLPEIAAIPPPRRLLAAYSGGLDSTVLLHALARLRGAGECAFQLRALHVNHALSPHADAWQAHCEQVCAGLGVELLCRRAALYERAGASLESRAREARYRIFAETLEEGEVLLQAHHLDDQVETLLFRLNRGSGPRGLAGIPRERALGRGRLLRPLLDFERADLEAWAGAESLNWIDDESNLDTAFDRNFLRHEVLPLLASRWPAFKTGWQRSARLCAEADVLQDTLARHDLADAAGARGNRLRIDALAALDPARLRNLLRFWLGQLEDRHGLPPPDYEALRRIPAEVLPAADDANPRVAWQVDGRRAEVRRFRGELYALMPPEGAARRELQWRPDSPLILGPGLGSLSLVPAAGRGIPRARLGTLRVRFREDGESVKPAGRSTRPLKKIFQEYAVPPWLRGHVPLLCQDGEVVAVGDLFVCEGWLAEEGADLVRVRWERPAIHCGY